MCCKTQSYNWQLQLNQTGLLACNCSTGQRQQERSQLSLQKQCRNLKQSSKWPPPALTHAERWRRHWCTAAAMIAYQLSSYAVLEFVEISRTCFVHLLLLYVPDTVVNCHGFRSGEFGGHNRGRMDSGVSLSSNFTVARARCLIRKVK